MYTPSRRQFLQISAASLALLAGGPAARYFTRSAFAEDAPKGRELILLCDSDRDMHAVNGLRRTHPGFLKILDVASGETSAVHLHFFGHTANQIPNHAEQVVTFEKWGKRGALIDVKDKKVLDRIRPAAGKTFFGHCAFSTDGSVMVVTENNYEGTEGMLTFRNLSDMKVVNTCPSYGAVPHECRTPDNGKTIMVVNKGEIGEKNGPKGSPSSLAWVDWNSGKLLNKVEFDIKNNVEYGHCDLSFDNWACVAGRTDKVKFHDLVMFISPDGQALPVKLPPDIVKRLKGEALSIGFLGHSGLVGITVTKADLVLLIDYKTQELVEAVTMPIPNGILPILDGNDAEPSMLVSSADTRNLWTVKMKKGAKAEATITNGHFGGIGTHLSRIYV